MIFGCNFDVKMGGLDKPKQAIRIVLVATYEFSGNCDIKKIDAKRRSRMITLGASGFLRFWSVLENVDQSWSPKSKNQKKCSAETTEVKRGKPSRGQGGGWGGGR